VAADPEAVDGRVPLLLRLPAAAQDERDAQQRAQDEGAGGEDVGETQGSEDDADQVDAGPRDPDPGDAARRQIQNQRRLPLAATVDARPPPVNCGSGVLLRPSR
jgi:hypothetical protein